MWLFWILLFFFGSYALSEKYLGPKQSPLNSHDDLKKAGLQLSFRDFAIFVFEWK